MSGKILRINKEGAAQAEYHSHDTRVTAMVVDDAETALASVALDGKLAVVSLAGNAFDDLKYSLNYGPLTALCFGSTFAVSKFSVYIGSINGQLKLYEQGWFTPKEHDIGTHSTAILAIQYPLPAHHLE